MKRILFAIFVLFIVIYSFWWYTEAQKFKQNALTYLQKWQQNEEGRTFAYEEVSVNGYPFLFKLNFKNPQWQWQANHTYVPFSLHLTHVGQLTLSETLAGSSQWLKGEGTTKLTGQSSEINQTMDIEMTGPFELAWALDKEEKRKIFEIPIPIKEFNLQSKNVIWTFKDQEEQFALTFDSLSVLLDWNQSTNLDDTIHFKIDSPNYHFIHQIAHSSDKFEKIVKQEMEQLMGTLFKPHRSPQSHNQFALKGDLQLLKHQQKPTWLKQLFGSKGHLSDLLPTFSLNLQDVSWSNQFEKHEEIVKLSSYFEEDKYHVLLQNQGSALMSADYPKLINEVFDLERVSSLKVKTSAGQMVKNLFINHGERIKSLVPKLHEVGPIRHDIDVHLVFSPMNEASHQVELNTTIHHFDLTTDQYGVKNHSKLNGIWDAEDFPWEADLGLSDYNTWLAILSRFQSFTGTYTLNLVNYNALFADLIPYLNRWIDVTNSIGQLGTKMPPLNEEIVDPILTFLKNISDQPNEKTKDLEITATYLPAGQLLVGTLTPDQLVENYQKMAEEIESAWMDLVKEQKASEQEVITPSEGQIN
jgi:hypothetical protein